MNIGANYKFNHILENGPNHGNCSFMGKVIGTYNEPNPANNRSYWTIKNLTDNNIYMIVIDSRNPSVAFIYNSKNQENIGSIYFGKKYKITQSGGYKVYNGRKSQSNRKKKSKRIKRTKKSKKNSKKKKSRRSSKKKRSRRK